MLTLSKFFDFYESQSSLWKGQRKQCEFGTEPLESTANMLLDEMHSMGYFSSPELTDKPGYIVFFQQKPLPLRDTDSRGSPGSCKEHVIEALCRVKFKFPDCQKIHISKKWGFTKFSAHKFEDRVTEKHLNPDGSRVKHVPNHGSLSKWQALHSLEASTVL
ncbi:60S ribosomal protein L10 [Fukomys damarensis]|uniref:60S ribosomal protein L10 n=1 Tax=Fukomys damarensis TaxID=885580 RepID=A0A091D6Q6_FUKDA|nr:60S ribosomal protein L10 [Fukomys damarensis]